MMAAHFAQAFSHDRSEKAFDCAMIKHGARRRWRKRQINRNRVSLSRAYTLQIRREFEALLVVFLHDAEEGVDIVGQACTRQGGKQIVHRCPAR